MAYYRRSKNGGNKPGPNSSFRSRDVPSPEKIKKLDMRKEEEFRFLLSKAIEPLPDSLRGAIKWSVYSIASRKGVKEAKEYIMTKKKEGAIDSQMERKLIDLVFDYSKYR